MDHPIKWCGQPFVLKRVVVGHTDRKRILEEATQAGVSVVYAEDVNPLPGDIWAGVSPSNGWGAWHSICDEVGFLRQSELPGFNIQLLTSKG